MQSVVIKAGNGNSVMTSLSLHFNLLNSSINMCLINIFRKLNNYFTIDLIMSCSLFLIWFVIESVYLLFMKDTKVEEWKVKWI